MANVARLVYGMHNEQEAGEEEEEGRGRVRRELRIGGTFT